MNEVKIANPGPLGLAGFALTTFILSLANAGVFPGSHDASVVIGLALFYGGLAQLLAGMWEFRSGNTFGAVAFSTYGAFWLSFAALSLGIGGTALASNVAIGWWLIAWAIITGILMICSFRTNAATALVFILLFITYILLALGAFNKALPGQGLTGFGGWVGVATAIVAWYTAFAGVLASVFGGKYILPVIPLTKA